MRRLKEGSGSHGHVGRDEREPQGCESALWAFGKDTTVKRGRYTIVWVLGLALSLVFLAGCASTQDRGAALDTRLDTAPLRDAEGNRRGLVTVSPELAQATTEGWWAQREDMRPGVVVGYEQPVRLRRTTTSRDTQRFYNGQPYNTYRRETKSVETTDLYR